MTKNLALTLMLMGIFVLISEAQITRQYRDGVNLASVVVVKNSADISDIDILNSNFDLANVSMGDEIRITTEMLNEMNNQSNSTATIETSVPETPQIKAPTEIIEEPVADTQATEEAVPTAKTATPVVRPEVSRAKASTTKSTTRSTSNTQSSSSFKKKKKKNRIFLKKRRSVKKRRYNKCYAF